MLSYANYFAQGWVLSMVNAREGSVCHALGRVGEK